MRGLVERIVEELGVRGRVVVREEADGLHVDCVGGDAGVLIGRFGQTIDAVQYIVNAIVARRGGERIEVTVDAAGYRERRRRCSSESRCEPPSARGTRRARRSSRP